MHCCNSIFFDLQLKQIKTSLHGTKNILTSGVSGNIHYKNVYRRTIEAFVRSFTRSQGSQSTPYYYCQFRDMNYEMSFCEKNRNELKNPSTAVPPLPKIHRLGC